MSRPNQRNSACLLACGFACLLVLPRASARSVLASGVPLGVPDESLATLADGSAATPVHALLPNGLRIVLIQQRAPLVTLSVVYRLPTEPLDVRLAQQLRAMLPDLGTPHLSASARRRLLLTADTSAVRVHAALDASELVLTVSVPPDTVELALFIEADRMGFGAESLTQTTVEERERRAPQAVSELQGFMRRYLNARNATLVIQGPVESQSVLSSIARTFGKLRGGQRLVDPPAHASSDDERAPMSAERSLDIDRHRVIALSSLSLPEQQAILVARQLASDDAAGSDHAEPRTPDEPGWYRPPKKGAFGELTVPQVQVERPSQGLVLRYVEQPGAALTRVRMSGLLRDTDADPAVALVALCSLLRTGEGDASLVARLWNEHAVRLSWNVTSNDFSLGLTGVSARVGAAIPPVRDALQHAFKSEPRLAEAKRAALQQSDIEPQGSLLDQLRLRVGSPFKLQVDASRLGELAARIGRIDAKDVQQFWRGYAIDGEFAASLVGPFGSQPTLRAAAAALPAASGHAAPRARKSVASRIWILDHTTTVTDANIDLEVIWPSRDAELRQAWFVAGLSNAAKALGNLNAARPHNPTTQFILKHRNLAETEVDMVEVTGIDPNRLATVLREMEGYFERLVERVDYPQLSRLGVHDLQRRQLGWFASPSRTMSLLDEWSLSRSRVWYPLASLENLGLVPRDSVLTWARTLRLSTATIIAKGPTASIESSLRAVNRSELVVIRP